jgi:hypothetical protein
MTRRLALAAVTLALLPLGAALVPEGVQAKDEPKGLSWRRTYGEALLEARLRNVPVLVTRQKDG